MSETNKSSENSHSSRTRLPSTMVSRDDISIWSILKRCIGKELSKITMPVVFNEPLSLLQRLAESMEYIDLLEKGSQSPDPIERMEYVVVFAVASLSYNWMRLNKPFNPLLGETYEFSWEEIGARMICEQVSHHPPISAYHVDSKNFTYNGSCYPKLKFWGKSIEIKPEGNLVIKFPKYDEVYTWKNVNCCVHNIIIGHLWFEHYGTMEIVNHSNGLTAVIDFKPAGWFGKDLHRLNGFIYSSNKSTKLRFIYGKWTDYLKSADVKDYEVYMKEHAQRFRVPDKPENKPSPPSPSSSSKSSLNVLSKINSLTKSLTPNYAPSENFEGDEDNDSSIHCNNGDIPKSDSSHSLDIPNSKLLWVVNPRPDYSQDYYNFTLFTMKLNELTDEMKKYLAPTDSRFRPDIKLLEEGDLEDAAEEKNRLEEKQREVRKIRKKKRQTWNPLWFKLGKNPYTQEEDWIFNNTYWQRDFSKCEDIF